MSNKLLISLYNVLIKLINKRKVKEKLSPTDSLNTLLIINDDLQFSLSSTPLLNILHKSTNFKIFVLCSEENYSVFEHNEYIDKLLTIPSKLTELLKQILIIRKHNINIVIDVNEKERIKNSLFLIFSNAKYKIGFSSNFNNLLTHSITPKAKLTTHLVDRLLQLLSPIDIKFSKSNLNINFNIPSKNLKLIEEYIIKHDLKYNFISLICITGNNKDDIWGINNYKRIIKYVSNYETRIIIAAPYELLTEVEELASDKYPIFYYNDINEYAALIKNSNFIFTPDSYTVQLAAAFKIPLFCLFSSKLEGELINIPYNSDFDYVFTSKSKLNQLSLGNVLNNFVPYYDYVYQRYNKAKDEEDFK